MQIQTHVISAWCFGNLFNISPKQRLLCMLIAVLPDIDGIGILIDVKYYHQYHHILGHNIFFGALLSVLLALGANFCLKLSLIYFLMFQIHIVLDLLGSGPGWGIRYFWPITSLNIENPYVWELQSWQTMLTLFMFLVWTFAIAHKKQRTPLENLLPSLDSRLVKLVSDFINR